MTPPEVPPADEVTRDWWDATREHRLVVQQCSACGHLQHPPRAVCTGCGDMEHLALVPASGDAVVDSWTVIYRAPRPGVDVPYTVARVRLSEGPVLLTRLEDGPVGIGEPVRVRWVDLDDGRALPVFAAPPAQRRT